MFKERKHIFIISILILLVLTIMCWFLFEQIVIVYIDDVMYSDWTKHNFDYFINKNLWHYLNYNGRFIVHLAIQLITVFDEHLYALLVPATIIISSFLFTTIAKRNWTISKRLLTCALTLIFTLGLNYNLLVSLLWISGGFNYLIPILIISIFYYIFSNSQKRKSISLGLCVLSFISGATTEQYGMYTIGLIVLTIIFVYFEQKAINKNNVIYLGLCVLGFLSLLLAPASQNRLALTNTSQNNYMYFLLNGYIIQLTHLEPILPILFMFFIGFCAYYQNMHYNKYRKYLLAGFPFALISLILVFTNHNTVFAVWTTIFIGMVFIVLSLQSQTRELLKILVCGFGTFFMTSILPYIGRRIYIPCIFSFIIVLSIMLIDVLSNTNKKISSKFILALIITICLFNYNDITKGYKEKKSYCQNVSEQLYKSHETGIIEFNFDETILQDKPKYRYLILFDNGNFLKYYKNKFNIPDKPKIYISSNLYKVSNIRYLDTYLFLPIIHLNQEHMVATSVLRELSDFDTEFLSQEQIIEYKKSQQPKKVFRFVLHNKFKTKKIEQYNKNVQYINLDIFCKWFNLKYQYDKHENTYHFKKVYYQPFTSFKKYMYGYY